MFFPCLAFDSLFFTLVFPNTFSVQVIHVLSMLGVLGDFVTCYLACYLPLRTSKMRCYMGANHDKEKKWG
jgi:hypothetical protein